MLKKTKTESIRFSLFCVIIIFRGDYMYTKEEFIKKWLDTFVPNMTKTVYKSIIENQYIWHAFSFGFIDNYLVGKDARNTYDLIDKTDAIVFRSFRVNGLSESCPSSSFVWIILLIMLSSSS